MTYGTRTTIRAIKIAIITIAEIAPAIISPSRLRANRFELDSSLITEAESTPLPRLATRFSFASHIWY